MGACVRAAGKAGSRLLREPGVRRFHLVGAHQVDPLFMQIEGVAIQRTDRGDLFLKAVRIIKLGVQPVATLVRL